MTLTITAPTLTEQRDSWRAIRTKNREAEDAALWNLYLHWQLSHVGGTPWQFLTFMTDGSDESPGRLYAAFDRARARASGLQGSLTELALRGRALRLGHPRSETDALTVAQLEEKLRVQKVSESETATDALKPYQEVTRAHLAAADPAAPTAPTEADALNLSVLEVIADKLTPVYRAALTVAQTGDVEALGDLAQAVKPPDFYSWAKMHGKCWVTGRLPERGEIFDLHHVAIGGHEARRNDGGQECLVPVSRAAHIPQPFSHTQTAHSSAYSVGNDPEKLVALIEYLTAEHERYSRWIRGEE